MAGRRAVIAGWSSRYQESRPEVASVSREKTDITSIQKRRFDLLALVEVIFECGPDEDGREGALFPGRVPAAPSLLLGGERGAGATGGVLPCSLLCLDRDREGKELSWTFFTSSH